MAIYIVSGIALFCCALTMFLCKRYVRSAFSAIDQVLDRVLHKDMSLTLQTTGDSRISKLTHKASRIIGMYVSDAAIAETEKETIQGFISDMSHQMKTPLSGISMYSSLLFEGNLSHEEQQAFFSRIKAGTEKLQWMMDSLIKMSRLEVGAIQLSPARADIKQTITDSISGVVAAASKKNISITVCPMADVALLHDRKWTVEAINNVLENAVKYSAMDGHIEVSLERLTLYTKITITDNGIGIAADDYPLVFKRFYRGHNAKESEGAGLGLYLSALIMEKQGGYITVDSKPGAYTSFSLFLQNC